MQPIASPCWSQPRARRFGQTPEADQRYWLYQHEVEPRFDWGRLSYPAILPEHRHTAVMARSRWRWRGKLIPSLACVTASMDVPFLGHLRANRGSHGYISTTVPDAKALAPHQLLARMTRPLALPGEEQRSFYWGHDFVAAWTSAPEWRSPRVLYPETQFPPQWQRLCAVYTGSARYWNRDHWLVQKATRTGLNRLTELGEAGLDTRAWGSESGHPQATVGAVVAGIAAVQRRHERTSGSRASRLWSRSWSFATRPNPACPFAALAEKRHQGEGAFGEPGGARVAPLG
jgi:hypothetical protein